MIEALPQILIASIGVLGTLGGAISSQVIQRATEREKILLEERKARRKKAFDVCKKINEIALRIDMRLAALERPSIEILDELREEGITRVHNTNPQERPDIKQDLVTWGTEIIELQNLLHQMEEPTAEIAILAPEEIETEAHKLLSECSASITEMGKTANYSRFKAHERVALARGKYQAIVRSYFTHNEKFRYKKLHQFSYRTIGDPND